jgi:histidyl-tRNA synthetase
MPSKPSIPKGTRDFSPEEMLKREFIFDTIRQVFRLYGYQPIETPAMENLSTLLGKYGEEGDKLLFRILNSGDFLSSINDDDLLKREKGNISSKICEKGLRYDLTVPFARYVVQHRDEIVFPFKRYQIQPVWRADRPQKGRYREFFQCDVDVIGSDSLLNEYELIRIIDDIFLRLNITTVVKINNRKVLSGIAEIAGVPNKIIDITTAIDKIEKIGIDASIGELHSKGVSQDAINKLTPVLDLKGGTFVKLKKLKKILFCSEIGLVGIKELEELFRLIKNEKLKCKVELDLTLARGLNYYTGAIIEVKSKTMDIGSICGGGRYDNLTGIFGLKNVSGVGVSFGADRIYDVLIQLNRFKKKKEKNISAMLVNFGDTELKHSLKILSLLHRIGISAELYPTAAKISKQIGYANSKKMTYILMMGEDEIASNILKIKNMRTGVQKRIGMENLESFFSQILQD